MITVEQLNARLDYNRETGVFTWKKGNGRSKPGSVAGQISSWGYVRISLHNKKYSAHHLSWLMVYGEWPSMQIDHIDGNKTNNAIGNLRLVTPSLNQLCNNKPRSNNKTGYVGVSKTSGGYKAQIKINGEGRYLGEFTTAELAHAAYMTERNRHLAAHGIGGGE